MPVDLATVSRVRIVGVSGSGKTHLAAELARLLGVAHLELDAVFWDAGWVHRDSGGAHALIDDFLAAHPDGWVVEGNWTSMMAGRLLPGADGGAEVLVWLDHSRIRVMAQVVRRTLVRGLRRTELWHGNRETPCSWLRLDPEQNIVRWAWVQHPVMRERLAAALAGEHADVVVRLSGRRAVTDWLEEVRRARTRGA